MKILIVCDRYPGNLSDGLTLRVFHYVTRLSSHIEFDLICFDDVNQVEQGNDSLFHHIVRVPRPKKILVETLLNKLVDAFNPETLYLSSDDAQHHINQALKMGRYDVVWEAGCNMLRNVPDLREFDVALLADQVDDSFLRLKRDFENAVTLYSKIWTAKQYCLQWLFARKYLARADCALFVSSTDALSFNKRFPDTQSAVIENGVDEQYFSSDSICPQGEQPATFDMVFEGSMSFQPNIDAALYFVKEIFPLIKEKIADVRLFLVGRSPVPEILSLQESNVIVTGTVDDIRPYLSSERVFICPMRMGAGIKNKILQAWSMSMAIVSTTSGVGSIKCLDGHDILIRDCPTKFAEAVVNLFENPEYRRKLGNAGRNRVIESYTWNAKTRELEGLLKTIMNKKRTLCS